MNPLRDLKTSDIPSGGVTEAVPRQIVPAINAIHDALRDLDRRLLTLEQGTGGVEASAEGSCSCDEVETLREEIDTLREAVAATSGLGTILPDHVAELLLEWGFETPDDVAGTTDEVLLEIDGIGPATLEDIREQIPFDPDA